MKQKMRKPQAFNLDILNFAHNIIKGAVLFTTPGVLYSVKAECG